jgi:hypothetical protein
MIISCYDFMSSEKTKRGPEENIYRVRTINYFIVPCKDTVWNQDEDIEKITMPFDDWKKEESASKNQIYDEKVPIPNIDISLYV